MNGPGLETVEYLRKRIDKLGVSVIGASGDPEKVLATFRAKQKLNFPLVGDPSHTTDQGLYHSFEVSPDADDAGLPILRVRRQEIQPLLNKWSLDALARQIDRDLRPRSRALKDATVDYT